MARELKFGVQTTPQNCAWQDLSEAWKLMERLGYDTAWTFDHFFSILGDPSGPVFEGWTALAALAAGTDRMKAGVLVTGNTYRNPTLIANMAKTLDHAIGGRLIVGMGAGWFEQEHHALDFPFYTTAERIRRLDEALQIMKLMWTEKQATFSGQYYKIKDAYCEPKPIQKPYPPIMIGGAGEKMTLKVVAKHADMWNTFGTPDVFRNKIEVLKEHCANVGRNSHDIELVWGGATYITDSADEKDLIIGRLASAFGRPAEEVEAGFFVGPSSMIKDRINQYVDIGITHFIAIPAGPMLPTIRRFYEEVVDSFKR